MKDAREADSAKIIQFAESEEDLKAQIRTLVSENEGLSEKVKQLSPIEFPITVTKSEIQVLE